MHDNLLGNKSTRFAQSTANKQRQNEFYAYIEYPIYTHSIGTVYV